MRLKCFTLNLRSKCFTLNFPLLVMFFYFIGDSQCHSPVLIHYHQKDSTPKPPCFFPYFPYFPIFFPMVLDAQFVSSRVFSHGPWLARSWKIILNNAGVPFTFASVPPCGLPNQEVPQICGFPWMDGWIKLRSMELIFLGFRDVLGYRIQRCFRLL